MSKKELIIQTAKDLFFKYGLKKVSIEEIVDQCHISKATYYKYFPNKTELAKEVLNLIFLEDKGVFAEVLKSESSFEEKIRKLVAEHEKNFEKRSDKFKQDILDFYPELKSIFQNHKNEMYSSINSFLLENQKLGNIRQGINVNFVSEAIIFLTESVMKGDLGKEFQSKSSALRQITELFFYGMLNK